MGAFLIIISFLSAPAFAFTIQPTKGEFSNNLLPGDTSFETGFHPIMMGFLAWESYMREGAVSGEIDRNNSFEGKQSLRIHFKNRAGRSHGAPIVLESGEIYTFSFYAKANKPGRGKISFLALNWKDAKRKSITFTTDWKRYSVTMKAKNKVYFLKVRHPGNVDILWIDCLQLEKRETATPYKNGEPISANMYIPHENNRIFSPDEKIPVQFAAYKALSDLDDKNLTIAYTISDFYRNEVSEGEIAVSFNKGNIFKKTVYLVPEKLGLFIIRYQLKRNGLPVTNQALATYAVINPPVRIEKGKKPFCGYDVRATTLLTLKRAGVHWTQIDYPWKAVEPEKGKLNWAKMDELISSLKKEGFLIKAMFGVGPRWATEPLDKNIVMKLSAYEIRRSKGRTLPANLEDWRNFLRQFAARYKDKVDLYEIGGEFDLVIGDNPYYRTKYPEHVKGRFLCSGPVIDKYARMIKIGSEEILKVNPDAKIGAIRPSNLDCSLGFPFSTAVFKKAGKFFNLFPIDPYTGPRLIGPGRSETRDPEYLTAQFKQAVELGEKYGCGQHAYVSELAWYYDIREGFDSKYARKGVRKIIRSCLLSRMAPKVDYWHQMGGNSIFCTYTNHLCHWGFFPGPLFPAYSMAARIVENVSSSRQINLGPLVKAAVFEKSNQSAGVIWVVDNDKRTLEIPEIKGFSILDVFGNPVEIERKGDKLIIPIDGLPVYFVQKGKRGADKLFQTLSKGKVRGIPVKISFRPFRANQGELYLNNLTDNRLKGTTNTLVEGQKPFKQEFVIPVSETEVLRFHFSTDIKETKKIKIEVNCPGEDEVIACFSLDPFMECKKIDFPVEVNGNLKEWKKHPYILMNKKIQIEPSDPWIAWDGPEDLSARVYIGWDEKTVYLAAEVTDDKHFNKQRGHSIWNGDNIQVAFDFGNDASLQKKTAGYDDNDRDFFFALTEKEEVSSWRLPENAKLAVVRKGDKTCYEVAVPKSSLPKELVLSPGSIIGFNFVIFDDDEGAGQTYYYYLSRGITGGKNPRQFRKFILIE